MAEPKTRRLSFMDGLVLAIAADEKTVTRRLITTFGISMRDRPRGAAAVGVHLPPDQCAWQPMVAGDTLNVCEALVPDEAREWHPVEFVSYRADGEAPVNKDDGGGVFDWPWKVRVLPARYCPTWAVRYRRRIVSVTPERLSSVTDTEAVREGVARLGWKPTRENFLHGFRKMHGLADDANPWVWRIEWAPGDVGVTNG